MSALGRTLVALIAGQISLHACMAGLRMATPLNALRDGHAEWVVGVLLALFAAAPIVLALRAGRLADAHGYHRPLSIAVALTFGGGLCALAGTWFGSAWQMPALAASATLAGAGANFGLIAIQHTAGRSAANPVELKRVFSWLGLAPALANMAGPMLAGALIDLAGFRAAYAVLALLPLAALAWARRVPPQAPRVPAPGEGAVRRSSWELLRQPGLKRLLVVNWLLSASWDVHTFVLPILGHERGFSASAIGAILGVFAASVAAVRVVIPWLAHRVRESQVLAFAMLATGLVFALYPFMGSAFGMGVCAVGLGIALGCVQPMIMSMLHQITPHERHGEAIALRSMTINASSTVMPLLFGATGAALGAATLFWLMGGAVAAGSLVARRVGAAGPAATGAG